MMRLDLDGLEAASREALMSEWREVVWSPSSKAFKQTPDGADFEPTPISWKRWADIPSAWIAGSRAQRGAMWFGLPLNPEAALCGSITGSRMWLR